ncbi:MAG TPA: wax ester/triacylglycerol synthase family O-acyltransferase [Jatrophihabitans sp.]|nr:wax ester/triacylglycerol synthase family O-acyltransferase [Jatrophihabitans sp.]
MTRERMTAVDAAWLHMDRDTNRMIVHSVMWCDEPLDWAAVRSVLAQRLVERYPRFSQRVVEQRGGVWWEDDESFDLERHLHRGRLADPGGAQQLQDYVSTVVGKPLPRSVPLWEVYFLDGFRGRGSALVTRIHHCIADGVALARVMMSLTDDPQEAALAAVAPHAGHGPPGAGPVAQLAAGLLADIGEPTHIFEQMGHLAAGVRATGRLLTLPPDSRTCLHRPPGGDKHALWSEPVPLSDLRTAAHAAGVTVNDLMLTAVTGALRAYLARTDGNAPDVRAVIPVDLRPRGAPLPATLGNDFGLAYLQLPASIDDRRARLAELRRRTETLKRSPEALVALGTLRMIGRLPYDAEQVFVRLFAAKASAVVTNVAGPRRPVYLAGRRVCGTIAWPPESGDLALGVSIISYDGDVIIGLLTDTDVIRDPRRLLAETVGEMHELIDLCAVR